MRGVSLSKVGIIVFGFAAVLYVVVLRLPSDYIADHYYEGCMKQAGLRPATFKRYCRCMADYLNKNYTAVGWGRVNDQVREYIDHFRPAQAGGAAGRGAVPPRLVTLLRGSPAVGRPGTAPGFPSAPIGPNMWTAG